MSGLSEPDSPRDNVSFMELLTLHQTQLYGYIRALVHDAEDAKDIFQSTSLILWWRRRLRFPARRRSSRRPG